MMTNPNPYERAAMPEAPIYTQRQLDAAVATERERCARLCEQQASVAALNSRDERYMAQVLADEIRA